MGAWIHHPNKRIGTAVGRNVAAAAAAAFASGAVGAAASVVVEPVAASVAVAWHDQRDQVPIEV